MSAVTKLCSQIQNAKLRALHAEIRHAGRSPPATRRRSFACRMPDTRGFLSAPPEGKPNACSEKEVEDLEEILDVHPNHHDGDRVEPPLWRELHLHDETEMQGPH